MLADRAGEGVHVGALHGDHLAAQLAEQPWRQAGGGAGALHRDRHGARENNVVRHGVQIAVVDVALFPFSAALIQIPCQQPVAQPEQPVAMQKLAVDDDIQGPLIAVAGKTDAALAFQDFGGVVEHCRRCLAQIHHLAAAGHQAVDQSLLGIGLARADHKQGVLTGRARFAADRPAELLQGGAVQGRVVGGANAVGAEQRLRRGGAGFGLAGCFRLRFRGRWQGRRRRRRGTRGRAVRAANGAGRRRGLSPGEPGEHRVDHQQYQCRADSGGQQQALPGRRRGGHRQGHVKGASPGAGGGAASTGLAAPDQGQVALAQRQGTAWGQALIEAVQPGPQVVLQNHGTAGGGARHQQCRLFAAGAGDHHFPPFAQVMHQFTQGERQPLLTGVAVGYAQLAGVVPPGGRCQGLVEGRCGRIRPSGELFQLLAVAVHALAKFPGQAVGQAPGLIRGRGLRLIVLMLVPQSGAGADQHQAQQCEQPCRPGQNLAFVPHPFPLAVPSPFCGRGVAVTPVALTGGRCGRSRPRRGHCRRTHPPASAPPASPARSPAARCARRARW